MKVALLPVGCDDPFCTCVRRGYGDGGRGTVSVDETQIRARLEAAKVEHRDLDAAIEALALSGLPDQLQVARLKKRKLRLRDEIAMLEDQLIPDIIA